MEIDRTKLVNKIEQTAKAIPFAEILKGAFGRATTMVKQAFGELGQRLEFQIAASGYIDSSQEECLYDMVWYILENGMMVRQPMVLEIEWKNIPADVCDDEFQKLVQARANVRVWIATSPIRYLPSSTSLIARNKSSYFLAQCTGTGMFS